MSAREGAPAQPVAWHHDGTRRCLDCWESGAPFDGGCSNCGFADRRWVSSMPGDEEEWEPAYHWDAAARATFSQEKEPGET